MTAPPEARHLFRTRTAPSWLLDKLIVADEHCPGLLRRYYMTSDWRRQCIGLVFCDLDFGNPEPLAGRLYDLDPPDKADGHHPFAVICRVVLQRRIRDIVRCLHPGAEGLSRTLQKLGADPLSVPEYRTLVEFHTRPEHRGRVHLLRHVSKIPKRAIPMLAALEAPFILLPLLKKLGSIEQVQDFMRAIELIRRVIPQVTDEQLVASLSHLKGKKSIGDWIKRWLSHATTFWTVPPIQDDAEIVCLHSAAAIRDAARRFGNCLAGQTLICALGRSLYLEYQPSPVIIGLLVLNDGYLLEGMYGPQNAPPDLEIRTAIIQKLMAAGVHVLSRDFQACRYNRVARLASIYDFTRDDLDNDVFDI